MTDIRLVAIELTTLSPLMIDKEKLALEEIADGEQVVSLDAVDLIELDGEEVCVFTTKEYPNYFSFGGVALKNLVNGIMDKTKATIDEINVELSKTPLEMIFTRAKTKKGRDVTTIKII